MDKFFNDYASYHRTTGNVICHFIGIPTIVLSILGLTSHVGFLGLLIWAGALLWYLRQNWKLAIPFGLVSLGMYFVGSTIPVFILWGLFVGGWVVQYMGHFVFEKNSPAFYKNGEHLLVGPLWIFAKLIGYTRR